MNLTKRNVSIDIIKGIGIFLMVSGHGGAPYTHFIYLFHMAIFFIASGYLFNSKHSQNLEATFTFIKRKFHSLWLPYIGWMSIFSILHNFFIKINIYTDNPRLLDYLSGKFIKITPYWSLTDVLKNISKGILLHGGSQVGSAMWFLATLMEINILYCLINFCLKRKLNQNNLLIAQGIIAVFFLLIGYILSLKRELWFGYARVFSFYILFYLGHIIKIFNFSNYWKTHKAQTAVLIICFLILLSMNKIGSIDLGNNSYVNPLYLLIVSCVGWQFLYEIAELIKGINPLRKFWVIVGRNTLSVVILHFLSFKIINLLEVIIMRKPDFLIAAFPTLYTNNGWWIGYVIVGLTIPILLNIMRKDIIKNYRR